MKRNGTHANVIFNEINDIKMEFGTTKTQLLQEALLFCTLDMLDSAMMKLVWTIS